jgi:hypothetical protein
MIKENEVLIIENDDSIIRLYKRMLENSVQGQVHIKLLYDIESIDKFFDYK